MKCWTTSATSPRPAADSLGRRAGFTIIEVLIVIGVVLLVGAISIPFTLQQFERRTETEAIDRLGLLIRLARAESRSSGVPMEVQCDASGRLISVLRVDPRDPPTVEGDGGELEPTDDPDRRLLDSWSMVELPASLAIIPVPEDEGEELFPADLFDSDLDRASDLVEDRLPIEDPWLESTRLVLLVPDGTAISIKDFGLRSSRGWRRLRIDPWTAVMTVEVPPSPEALEAAETAEQATEEDLDSEFDSMDDLGEPASSDSEVVE